MEIKKKLVGKTIKSVVLSGYTIELYLPMAASLTMTLQMADTQPMPSMKKETNNGNAKSNHT